MNRVKWACFILPWLKKFKFKLLLCRVHFILVNCALNMIKIMWESSASALALSAFIFNYQKFSLPYQVTNLYGTLLIWTLSIIISLGKCWWLFEEQLHWSEDDLMILPLQIPFCFIEIWVENWFAELKWDNDTWCWDLKEEHPVSYKA